jgi:single-strand DNA-binding protein
MPYLNKILLIGHAGRDAELRFTAGGMAVTKFSLAVSEKIKDEKHTEWFDVTAFNKTAEFAGEDVRKGLAVYVEGRIRTEKWTDKEGKPREKRGVIADSVKVFKKAKPPEDETQKMTLENHSDTYDPNVSDDEMPF